MSKSEIGRIKKGNVTLIEYGEPTASNDDRVFIQVGVAGIFCDKKELKDLLTVVDYFVNMEDFSNCEIIIKDGANE